MISFSRKFHPVILSRRNRVANTESLRAHLQATALVGR